MERGEEVYIKHNGCEPELLVSPLTHASDNGSGHIMESFVWEHTWKNKSKNIIYASPNRAVSSSAFHMLSFF